MSNILTYNFQMSNVLSYISQDLYVFIATLETRNMIGIQALESQAIKPLCDE